MDQQISQSSPESSSRMPFRHQGAGLTSWILFLLLYTILANIPFWVASRWLGFFQSGWFCLDYVLVGLLALFVPRIVGGLLLLFVIAVDVIVAVSETYFLPLSQFFKNMTAASHFSASRLVALVSVIFLVCLVGKIATVLPVAAIQRKYRVRTAVSLIAFPLICLSIDCMILLRRTGNPSGFAQLRQLLPDGIDANYVPELLVSRIPAFRLVHRKLFPAPSGLPIQGATAIALSLGDIGTRSGQEIPNLVVVLVESWGLDTERAINEDLVQPYAQENLLARYEVLRGTVPFAGPTLGGEGRELCGSTIGFQLIDASPQQLQSCLPKRMTTMGYHDVSIHGMNGDMFDRSKWYRTMGFQEMWFNPQFQQEKLSNCEGAFWGTCDASIAEWMGRFLAKRKANPEFLYWVTLNSHLPVPVPAPLQAAASCSVSSSLAQQPELCSWYELIANVHHSVADLAMANLGRPTVFVIVGDHAPPFNKPALRDQFSPTVVPYVLLIPRDSAGGSLSTSLENK